ncbi:MAG: TonB-dependent receptor [Bacteroidales bacterium]
MIKYLVIILTVFSFILKTSATETEANLAKRTIKGFVYDSMTEQPMEYATVSLFKADDNSLVTGTITDVNGFFRLKDLGDEVYRMEVTFIGYKTKVVDEVDLTAQSGTYDLGIIMIEPTDAALDEVVIAADRPTMTYKIDKKVINVSEQHASASGTAIEVLENVPSITVSIEGDVSLRGSSSFTVLVDGKPSILDANDLLNQIPASQIENIEIITNPSARFDPDGVAGIINIVMKKQRLQGLNGVVNVSGGTHSRYGGDFLINYRRERLNYYLGADYNQRGFFGESVRRNETYGNDSTFLHGTGDFERGGYSWGFRGGLDFNINPKNTFSISYRMGDRQRQSLNNMLYEEWTSADPDRISYSSYEEGSRGGFSHRLNMDYKKIFNNEDHNILAQVVLSKRDFKEYSLNYLYDENEDITSGQQATEEGPGSSYTIMLDYTLPLNETHKLEAGYHTRIRLSEEEYNMEQYNTEIPGFETDDFYSKYVEYENNLYSLYSTFSGEMGSLGYQFGLRGEYTDRFIDLVNETDDYELTRWDYYPTVHFSYELPKKQQMMTSYTRRLQRLRGWYLEPFYTWRDAYNVRIGNPGLDPEYIDSYELSYQNRFNNNVFSFDLYYRVTHNKIERVRSVFDEYDNVLLTTFENVGKDYSLGTEIMFSLEPLSWWNVDLMGNIYDYRLVGELDGEDFSAKSFNWNLRLNNNIRIGKNTRLQLMGMYYSPSVMAQGRRSDFFMVNTAIKQDFFQKSLSLTLQVRDVFSTMGRESVYEDTGFYSYSRWAPDTPIVTLTASFRINNYRQRQGRPQNGESMDDMNGGEGEF